MHSKPALGPPALPRFFRPLPALAPYVACIELINNNVGEHGSKARFFPNGTLDLIFNLAGQSQYTAQQEAQPLPSLAILGLTNTFQDFIFSGQLELIRVNFRYLGVRALFGEPRILDRPVISLTDYLPALAERMLSPLAWLPLAERVERLQQLLLQQIDPGLVIHHDVRQALALLYRSRGSLRIAQLASTINVSKRHLERLFVSEIGHPPKLHSQLIRFSHARKQIAHQSSTTSSLAADLGYADQSHFIAEFQRFAGITPQTYVKAVGESKE
jgi:AraC-like DNA-binding protein